MKVFSPQFCSFGRKVLTRRSFDNFSTVLKLIVDDDDVDIM